MAPLHVVDGELLASRHHVKQHRRRHLRTLHPSMPQPALRRAALDGASLSESTPCSARSRQMRRRGPRKGARAQRRSEPLRRQAHTSEPRCTGRAIAEQSPAARLTQPVDGGLVEVQDTPARRPSVHKQECIPVIVQLPLHLQGVRLLRCLCQEPQSGNSARRSSRGSQAIPLLGVVALQKQCRRTAAQCASTSFVTEQARCFRMPPWP